MSLSSIDNVVEDNVLVSRAKSGDSIALSVLIEKYSDKILKKAHSFKNLSGLDAEDLYQEGMLGFVSAIYSFDANRGAKFSTYSSTVSLRRMLSAIRKSHKNLNNKLNLISLDDDVSDLLSQEPSPEDAMIHNEELSEILTFADNNFSKTERKVFKLVLLGISYSEIADILDCSTKSVDNALQRIRRKIRSFKSDK